MALLLTANSRHAAGSRHGRDTHNIHTQLATEAQSKPGMKKERMPVQAAAAAAAAAVKGTAGTPAAPYKSTHHMKCPHAALHNAQPTASQNHGTM
jgi:hypothetical protein